jgi:hypothetical protein
MPLQLRTDKLNVSDRVLVSVPNGFRSVLYRPGIVSRKTQTGIATVTVDGIPAEIVFGNDGRERGNRNSGRILYEFDQTLLENSERAALIGRKRVMLENYELWRKRLSNETILKIADIVEGELAGK